MTHRPSPPNHRPYTKRVTGEPSADELITYHESGTRQLWRQAGWLGASGALYSIDEHPANFEASFDVMWVMEFLVNEED